MIKTEIKMVHQSFLSNFIKVRGHFHRSVQIKMDWRESNSLNEYVLSPTAQTLAEQIYQGAFSPQGPKSWSIIGPYGTGKSAFSLFMADLLCHIPATHPVARELQVHLESGVKPFLPVLITGQRTHLARELLRSLAENLKEIAPDTQKAAELLAQQPIVPDQEVIRVFQSASQDVLEAGYDGLLVIIDEFGKFLEFAAQQPDVEDIFILQHLAEMAERSSPPVVLVTVLHTAFIEYMHILDKSTQFEWQKIQGRFTNAPFLEPYEQLIQLVGLAIEKNLPVDLDERYKVRIEQITQSEAFSEAAKRLRLEDLLERCTPLDPFTALILPPLFRSKLTQNERSLFAFLTSREPYSFQNFLENTPTDSQTPFYRIDQLYDYVLAALGSSVYLGDRAHRWAGIEAALQRVKADWPVLANSVVKAIGLLGLYGPQVGLKPSPETLSRFSSVTIRLERSLIDSRKNQSSFYVGMKVRMDCGKALMSI